MSFKLLTPIINMYAHTIFISRTYLLILIPWRLLNTIRFRIPFTCRFIRYVPAKCNTRIVSLLQHRAIISIAFKASLTNITVILACLHWLNPISDLIVDNSCDYLTHARLNARRHAKDNYSVHQNELCSDSFRKIVSPSRNTEILILLYLRVPYII